MSLVSYEDMTPWTSCKAWQEHTDQLNAKWADKLESVQKETPFEIFVKWFAWMQCWIVRSESILAWVDDFW